LSTQTGGKCYQDLPEEHLVPKLPPILEPLHGERYETVDRAVERDRRVIESSRHLLHRQCWTFWLGWVDGSRCCSLECKPLFVCSHNLSGRKWLVVW